MPEEANRKTDEEEERERDRLRLSLREERRQDLERFLLRAWAFSVGSLEKISFISRGSLSPERSW